MDELPKGLMLLVEDTRSADEPTRADARRVGAALSAAIPGFVPIGLGLAEATTLGTAEAASQAAQGASVKSAWFGWVGSSKVIGAMLTVVVAGAAAVMQQRTPEPPARSAKAVTKQVVQVQVPVVNPAPAEAVAVPAAAPRETGSEAPEPRAAQRPPNAKAKAKASAAVDTRNSELELIQGALGALHSHDAGRAERLLREHAMRFPNGPMATEREGLLVVALCEQDRRDEAQSLKSDFLEYNAASPIAARVRRACR